MISVKNLTKLYDEFPAVQDFNLEVGAGELVGLVGPNGAGKTTILRCLTGVIPPTTGTISTGTAPSGPRGATSSTTPADRVRSHPQAVC